MKNNYYFLYYFFDNSVIRWLRVFIFFGIGVIVYFNINNPVFIIHLLPAYFILILQEFFIHFKLENSPPSKKISDNPLHVIECTDFKTRVILEREKAMAEVIRELLGEGEVKYFNKLLQFSFAKSDVDIFEEQVLQKAATLVSSVEGSYIYGIDIYAAYILLLDSQNKTLFEKGIDEKDVITILSWARKQYGIDRKKKHHLRFTGSGAFDFFVFGWNQQLLQYAYNFTREVLSKTVVTPIGREKEYDLLITALSKNHSSNVLLVGSAGVGKTALIAEFALDSDMGVLPKNISNKIVFKFYSERLLAGVENQGDLEARFVELFSELAHSGNVVVYIPNIENIFGGGGLNMDISGALIEYLKSSKIKIIGSTTEDAFNTYIYQKQEIKELFDVVEVAEPDPETALFMVLEKSKDLERINHVSISYKALKEVCSLSDAYENDGTALPGRAIRLLEDVISNSKTHGINDVTEEEVRSFVGEKTNLLLDKPDTQETEKLLDLEATIHKRVISQDEAVAAISNAMRRVRSGLKNEGKPIASFLFLGPTGVGKTQTAKALAASYFGNETEMIRLDMSEYQSDDAVSTLLGGGFVDKILKNPFSLVLLDEFEKAAKGVHDLFLQVLDEGRLTDHLGRVVSFKNAIIIATSNAGSEFIREKYKEGVVADNVKKELIEKIQQSGIYKPELINRFDDVIVFRPLSEKDAVSVAKLFLQESIDKISEQQITLTYSDDVTEFIAKNSFSTEFGARNVRRFIEQTIENQLSILLLSNTLQKGSTATVAVENNSLVIR